MKICLTAVTAMLTACSTAPPYPDTAKYQACDYEATKATAGGTFYRATSTFGAAYAEAKAYRQVLDACMRQ